MGTYCIGLPLAPLSTSYSWTCLWRAWVSQRFWTLPVLLISAGIQIDLDLPTTRPGPGQVARWKIMWEKPQNSFWSLLGALIFPSMCISDTCSQRKQMFCRAWVICEILFCLIKLPAGTAWGHCSPLLPLKGICPSIAGALHSTTLILTHFLLVIFKPCCSWNVKPLLRL